MRRLFLAALILCSGLTFSASAALFAAADAAFGSKLADRVAVHGSSTAEMRRSALKDGLLYFSVTIVGDAETLAWLEEYGHLPLYVTFWGDNTRFDTVDIGIRPEKWASEGARLSAELAERGVFTFRTHYRTKKLGYRRIELTLKDAKQATIRTVSGSRNVNPSIQLEP